MLACSGVWRAVVATTSRAAASAGPPAGRPPAGRTASAPAGPRPGRAGGRAPAPGGPARRWSATTGAALPRSSDLGQHAVGQPARGAVQRALQDAEAGGDHGVRMGARRGGDPGGQGRGRQIVVDQQAEGRVQDASDAASAGRAVSRATAAGPAGPSASPAASRPSAGGRAAPDQGRDQARARCRAPPPATGRSAAGRRPPRRSTATRSRSVDPLCAGSAPTVAAGGGEGLGRRLKRTPGPQLTGPQPLGDLLVAVAPGQLRRVDPAEVVPVRLDERDAGTDDQLAAGRWTRLALAAVAPGQRLAPPRRRTCCPGRRARAGC